MQFKYLNMYKIGSTFATNLVGAFIPLIVYSQTGSLTLALLYIPIMLIFRMLSSILLRRQFQKYPQLYLLLRVIPLAMFNIFLLLLSKYMVVSFIFLSFGYGLNLAIKNVCIDLVFNYSTGAKSTSKSNAITRIVDNGANVGSAFAGGLFLQLNQTVLIVMSLVLYILSCVPLFIYYLKNRTKKSFNKDYTSNAQEYFQSNEKSKQASNKIVKTIMKDTFFTFVFSCFIDYFTTFYNLFLFVESPSFARAGYLTSVYQLAQILGNIFIIQYYKKHDPSVVYVLCLFVAGVAVMVVPFVSVQWLVYVLFAVYGFTYSASGYLDWLLIIQKARILGANNNCIYAKQLGVPVGQALSFIPSIICGMILPAFFVMGIANIIYGCLVIPKENYMRKKMVNYLQSNEIEVK